MTSKNRTVQFCFCSYRRAHVHLECYRPGEMSGPRGARRIGPRGYLLRTLLLVLLLVCRCRPRCEYRLCARFRHRQQRLRGGDADNRRGLFVILLFFSAWDKNRWIRLLPSTYRAITEQLPSSYGVLARIPYIMAVHLVNTHACMVSDLSLVYN